MQRKLGAITTPLFREQVLLYSGGMDSFIAAYATPPAKLLYINTHASYSEKELHYLPDHAPRAVTIDTRLDLSAQERDDAIVPARNLLLVTLASHYGHEVLLAATAGDQSTDKDRPFADMTSELLSHIYSGKHFPDSRGVVVSLPFKESTKAEMVRWYLDAGYDPVVLCDTVSCYHPTIKHCGRCKACLRKWVALEYNGCDTTAWDKHPREADWDNTLRQIRATQGWRHPREDKQTLAVLA